jgi:hypothetical protein
VRGFFLPAHSIESVTATLLAFLISSSFFREEVEIRTVLKAQ